MRDKSTGRGLVVLILAAGQGTRMESVKPKVLHPMGGYPMLFYLLRLANALKPQGIGVVVGHMADEVQTGVEENIKKWGINRPITFIRQKQSLGSGHAVVESVSFLKKFQTALIYCGDTPLLTFETIFSLLKAHQEQKSQATLLSAKLNNPKGYGRIVRSPMGDVLKIVEESETSGKEASILEVNSGVYCFEVSWLLESLKSLTPKGMRREYYLTDMVEALRSKGCRVLTQLSGNPEEILGVNSKIQMSQVERILNRRVLERLMLSGVTVVDPTHTYVDSDVEVGQDSVIYPGTILKGRTKVGKLCTVGPFVYLEDTVVGNESEIKMASCLVESRVLDKSVVGPFAHLRPASVVGPKAKIGNFTEIKASRIGFGSKVPHLSYVGDADIAEEVNIGAGTITCNFDGTEKHKTIIGPKAFIGSNVNLVAPVRIGRGAKVGAGSTITEDVPEDSLAIARSRQVVKSFGKKSK
ncbi:MAG: bifunctional UDP-N-acetylglucosamine diphosphorylase/glucosamine-1-phosphate N-acetyltransferase GlmU [Elusimicrobia bacterium]|nr:bifunctional UDP-N-acetylglucosamine diphosphorylase/glucosamine-1-phosphate N-acetyltransferase GlmU [Elusimicrobiota bacterium]